MKKFFAKYSKHYVSISNEEYTEELIPQYICMYADSFEEVVDKIQNSIIYSYTHYNTVDRIVEITEWNVNRFKNYAEYIDNPVNPDMRKDWVIDKREKFFG